MFYCNLEIELMDKKGVSYENIAELLGVSVDEAKKKMADDFLVDGKCNISSGFSVTEAMIIRDGYFSEYRLDYVFRHSVPVFKDDFL